MKLKAKQLLVYQVHYSTFELLEKQHAKFCQTDLAQLVNLVKKRTLSTSDTYFWAVH